IQCFLVMVAAYTRFIVAMMSPLRVTGDLLAGMWQLLQGIGAVPRTIMWDNESGIGQLTEGMVGFCGVLAARIIQTDPLSTLNRLIRVTRMGGTAHFLQFC